MSEGYKILLYVTDKIDNNADKLEFRVRSTTKIGLLLYYYLQRLNRLELIDFLSVTTPNGIVCDNDTYVHDYGLEDGNILTIDYNLLNDYSTII